jgi:hypothetical protein
LDGEAIPLSELVELALGDGHFNELLLREVHWLEFLLLQADVDFVFVLLLVVEADVVLLVEEVDVTEVTCSAARVELLGLKCGPVVGVEGEGRIFTQIRRHDEAAAPDLVLSLRPSCSIGGTRTQWELSYHPPLSGPTSSQGTGWFSSNSCCANSTGA